MTKDPKVGIVDHNYANIHSVKKALDFLGCKSLIIHDPKELEFLDGIVLPGVGAFDSAMKRLNEVGFTEKIKEIAKRGIPIIGVCMGMQLLFKKSQEGSLEGLGLIDGEVTKIDVGLEKLKIPHIGWNKTHKNRKSVLMENVNDREYFYYVHGFKCEPTDKSIISSHTVYGEEICSSIETENIYATQFHPEKSGIKGLEIYKNFINGL